MAIQAFIFVKTVPGKTRKVVGILADDEMEGTKKVYKIKGMKHVYRASGEYDVIAHVSAKNTQGIFELEELIGNIKGSPEAAVSATQVLFLAPKSMGDP